MVQWLSTFDKTWYKIRQQITVNHYYIFKTSCRQIHFSFSHSHQSQWSQLLVPFYWLCAWAMSPRTGSYLTPWPVTGSGTTPATQISPRCGMLRVFGVDLPKAWDFPTLSTSRKTRRCRSAEGAETIQLRRYPETTKWVGNTEGVISQRRTLPDR